MGGAAFASGPDALYTPRMPSAVYQAVRDRCHAMLRTLFVVVATPVEGPGKADFGDVDILVAFPKEDDARDGDDDRASLLLLNEATTRLGAVRTMVAAHEGKASMAVPWPADLAEAPADALADADADADARVPHIQVDLAVTPSLPRLHWALFKHAHGDLWNILGSAVLRPLGLTVDERALWLRVPEIERAHRSRAKVLLTDEPADVLHFLGLKVLGDGTEEGAEDESAEESLWEKPFPTAQALFEYSCTCRFFALPPADGEDGELAAGLALKSNDRRRLNQRPLFRQWATEFVPACRAAGRFAAAGSSGSSPGDDVVVTRDAVREAAFAWFPGAQARYEAARDSWLRERHLLAVRAAAKAAVPADLPSAYRGEVCAAVRRRLRLVMDGPDSAASAASRAAAEEAAAAWTVDGVAAHVAAHWRAISAEASPAQHARYLASLEGNAKERKVK